MKKFSLLLVLMLIAVGNRQCVAADEKSAHKRVLCFTKSSGYQHSVINRGKTPERLSFAEQILTDLGAANGIDVVCTKDGSQLSPDKIPSFDGFIFFTCGDLTKSGTDKQPSVAPDDLSAFLESIHNGKGFVGIHSAADTLHGPPGQAAELLRDVDDSGNDRFSPYIQMLGGEFIIHGKQQASTLHCTDEHFPGAVEMKELRFTEEWYSLKNFAPDLHVILTQDPTGMVGNMYQRQTYPETWAHLYGKGRVFYTSMGHREDVWKKAEFQALLAGAMKWSTGLIDVDVQPNIKSVTPAADPKRFSTDRPKTATTQAGK